MSRLVGSRISSWQGYNTRRCIYTRETVIMHPRHVPLPARLPQILHIFFILHILSSSSESFLNCICLVSSLWSLSLFAPTRRPYRTNSDSSLFHLIFFSKTFYLFFLESNHQIKQQFSNILQNLSIIVKHLSPSQRCFQSSCCRKRSGSLLLVSPGPVV